MRKKIAQQPGNKTQNNLHKESSLELEWTGNRGRVSKAYSWGWVGICDSVLGNNKFLHHFSELPKTYISDFETRGAETLILEDLLLQVSNTACWKDKNIGTSATVTIHLRQRSSKGGVFTFTHGFRPFGTWMLGLLLLIHDEAEDGGRSRWQQQEAETEQRQW